MAKKAKKDYGKATLAGAKKEMAKPRVAKSEGKNYANLSLSVVWTRARKPPRREAAESHFEGKLLKKWRNITGDTVRGATNSTCTTTNQS